jgi:hypothetical protein
MNANDGRMLALIFFGINAVLLAICVGMVKWSRSWQTKWAQIAVLVVFGLGSLLFGVCSIGWGWVLFVNG